MFVSLYVLMTTKLFIEVDESPSDRLPIKPSLSDTWATHLGNRRLLSTLLEQSTRDRVQKSVRLEIGHLTQSTEGEIEFMSRIQIGHQ